MSTSEPPTWPHCGYGADPAAAPVGCRGIHVPGHTACLAHLADADRDAYLADLTPGASIDHRGTTFTESLLNALLNAVRDPTTGHPRLGDARFGWATFEGAADFEWDTFEGAAHFEWATFEGAAVFQAAAFKSAAVFRSATFKGSAKFGAATFVGSSSFDTAFFKGLADFESATFKGGARFNVAAFKGPTSFDSAAFKGDAWFEGATAFERLASFARATFEGDARFSYRTFKGDAWFDSATFKRDARFDSATFEGDARFDSGTFKGDAWFESATFKRDARFDSATFVEADRIGPFVCGRVVLSGAKFGGPVTLLFAARRLECRRTRWSSTAEIHLRYATVDFAHAVFEYPLTIAAEPDPFVLNDGRPLAEDLFPSAYDPGVRVASLRGVDAAHLVLADLDLWECLFVGTVHLDQLRLEGDCTFNTAPPGVRWRRWPPVRFTERRVLAEEHHWRASQPGAVQGWGVGAGRAGPLQLAPVYRALRKAFEDGKHEPGAADFYYGEMEMRRHADDIPRSERGLLTAYWALSGYGLRASRALAWLGAAMLLTIVLLMAFGLAQDTPKQTATGTVPAGGGKVTFEIHKDEPRNPTGDWNTGERFEKALNVTLNSVVFRSSGQDLTTAGTYIEMTSRFTEPVLLGLAVLAVRNRVKR
ncbi:pentapeptide repeat-containing protein [Streptomyces chartreusis]|uniref:pentapeptide repeat-containing protein n=1 Tax=Streptomyces chartreusis TaxID=1969 RepID=UPI0033BC5D44